MPRYEFVEGSSSKFWEIAVAGKTVTTSWGRIGGSETSKDKSFASPAAAKAEHDKLVAEKTKKGYALVGGKAAKATPKATKTTTLPKKTAATAEPAGKAAKGSKATTAKAAPAVEPRDKALEKAIRDDPDDAGAYSVYGDWLAEQGHPRGELATAQLSGNAAAAKKLLAKTPALWGGLAEVGDLMNNVVWKGGFIERARVFNTYERYNGKTQVPIAEVIGTLVTGAGRFLRELTVGIVNFEGNSYAPITEALAKHGPIPTLRTLFYGDFHSEETELNWSSIGKLAPLYRAAPNLERLKLRSYGFDFGPAIALPKLRSLQIITGGLDEKAAKAIVASKFPALERLDLMFGRGYNKGLEKAKVLAPLLEGKLVPKLAYLGLKNFSFATELVPLLLASKLLRQVKTLDLSFGTLADDTIDTLLAGKAQLAHLDELVVGENYFTDAGLKRLKGLGVRITAKVPPAGSWGGAGKNGQRTDEGPDDRYPAVYE